MRLTKFALPIILLAALVVLLAAGLKRNPAYVPSPLVGKAAPAFSLPQLGAPEQLITEKALQGDVSLVNVWATWCVGCREEHAFLVELAQRGDVRIIGLNWKDDPALAQQWLQSRGNPYAAIAVDQDGRTAIDWGVYGAPETFLLDAAGVVLYKHIAPLTAEVWEAEFVPRIRSAREAAGR